MVEVIVKQITNFSSHFRQTPYLFVHKKNIKTAKFINILILAISLQNNQTNKHFTTLKIKSTHNSVVMNILTESYMTVL